MLKISVVVAVLSMTSTEGMRLGDFVRGQSESKCLEIGGTVVNFKSGHQACIRRDQGKKKCLEKRLELMEENFSIPEEYC